MDSRYYQSRPRSAGSETQRRQVNKLGRAVADHGAHKISGSYGKFRDEIPDAPTPAYQAAPEVAMGYCHFHLCKKAIPKAGMRADARFCSEAHSKAFRRREAQRNEFNRQFKNYWDSARGKAEAKLQADASYLAAVEMKESARSCGIDGADFFATPTGVVAQSNTPLPPVRIRAMSQAEGDGYGPKWNGQVLEVQTSDVPELGAILYTFAFPSLQPNALGLIRCIEAQFLGDLGTERSLWVDCYHTPAQEEEDRLRRAKLEAERAKERLDAHTRRATWERAEAQRKARGGPGTTSARKAHAEERMRNLLARPRHEVIAMFEEVRDYDGLKEFYAALRRVKNQLVRDNGINTQSKQRVA